MSRDEKRGPGEGRLRLEKDPEAAGGLRLAKAPDGGLRVAAPASGDGGLRLGAESGSGTQGDGAASGAGGLRLTADAAAMGGLRLDGAGSGGATPAQLVVFAVEAAMRPSPGPAGASSAPAQTAPSISFSFSLPDIGHWNAEMGKGSAATLQLLGLWDERATLLANEGSALALRERISAFVAKKDELARKGTNFQHLKNMPANFRKWLGKMEALANLDAPACAAELIKLARDEARAVLLAEARKAYETNDTSEKLIDHSEWVVLHRSGRSLGLPQDEALEMCLAVCREVTGDAGWSPPPEPAVALQLLEEQRRASEAKRKDDEAARKRDDAARKRAEAREKQLAAEAEAARAREAEAKAQHDREQIARERAEEERKQAEEARKRSEAEAAAERARLEELRAQQALQQAGVRLAVRGLLAGGLVGLVLAGVTTIVGTPTVALVEARKDMVAALPEDSIREVCGLGRDVAGLRSGLKVELGDRLAAVAVSGARDKAAASARPVCNGSQGAAAAGETPEATPAPTTEAK